MELSVPLLIFSIGCINFTPVAQLIVLQVRSTALDCLKYVESKAFKKDKIINEYLGTLHNYLLIVKRNWNLVHQHHPGGPGS